MKYLFSTLLLLTLLCTRGRAQNYQGELKISPQRNTVVATGGLNLRAAPGTHGKVVGKLPFGTKVELLSEEIYAPDSLNRWADHLPPNGWARVRAGDVEGYLYDAYLYFSAPKSDAAETDETFPAGINTKYQLITPYGSATGAYDPFAHKWFGLFAHKKGVSLSRVKPSFRFLYGEIEDHLRMVADGKRQPSFFVGGPNAWATGKRAGVIIDRRGTAKDWQRDSEAACAAHGISVAPGNKNSWASASELTLKSGGREQYLNPGGQAGSALYLEAAADLDGDGETDFIISYDVVGWDYSIMYVLFLSSEARPGELVRPVAMQYTYQGC